MAQASDADIIIVGGGTAGLLLAKELSDCTSLRIHVIEAGKDCSDHPDTQNILGYTANLGSEKDWQFESVPQVVWASVNDRSFTQNSGKLLGGSSSINGAYYVAPSRAGISAWSRLGNPTWSYEQIQNACLETVHVHPPTQAVCQNIGLESDTTVGTGPVQVSAGLEEHPITNAFFQAVRDLGYPTTSAIFSKHSAVGQSLYFAEDPASQIRSDANTACWQTLGQGSNVSISLQTTVKRIILDGAPPNVTAKGVEVVTSDGQTKAILANKEIILSAGVFGTPKLLELSGIGQSELLKKHGVPVVVESAHVGERLTNHIMGAVNCELAKEVPATTPTLKAIAYFPSKEAAGLEDVLREHANESGGDQKYDDQVKAIFLDPKEGSCMHFVGWLGVPNAWTFGVISAVPFAQGSTHIRSADVNEKPIVDPKFFSHPLDIEVVSRHLKTAASFASQPALKAFFKADAGRDIADADVEHVKEYMRENAMTAYHSCGTASMRPESDGGVVDEQLKVYETRNLRVVDASVIPMIAHGNPMATVYAVARRAAGIIKEAVMSA